MCDRDLAPRGDLTLGRVFDVKSIDLIDILRLAEL